MPDNTSLRTPSRLYFAKVVFNGDDIYPRVVNFGIYSGIPDGIFYSLSNTFGGEAVLPISEQSLQLLSVGFTAGYNVICNEDSLNTILENPIAALDFKF